MQSKHSLWLSGALTLLLFLAMAAYTWPLKPSIPCLQLTFSEAAFKDILAQWGVAGTDDHGLRSSFPRGIKGCSATATR